MDNFTYIPVANKDKAKITGYIILGNPSIPQEQIKEAYNHLKQYYKAIEDIIEAMPVEWNIGYLSVADNEQLRIEALQ